MASDCKRCRRKSVTRCGIRTIFQEEDEEGGQAKRRFWVYRNLEVPEENDPMRCRVRWGPGSGGPDFICAVSEEKHSASTAMLVRMAELEHSLLLLSRCRIFLHKSVFDWEVEWQRVSDGGQGAAAWPSWKPAPSWPQFSLSRPRPALLRGAASLPLGFLHGELSGALGLVSGRSGYMIFLKYSLTTLFSEFKLDPKRGMS